MTDYIESSPSWKELKTRRKNVIIDWQLDGQWYCPVNVDNNMFEKEVPVV